MSNFNLEKFKSERIASTRSGCKAKFICETRGQLLVEVRGASGANVVKYNLNGKRYNYNGEHFEDLIN